MYHSSFVFWFMRSKIPKSHIAHMRNISYKKQAWAQLHIMNHPYSGYKIWKWLSPPFYRPSFVQIWILFTQKCILESWVKINTVVLEKKFFEMYYRYFAITVSHPKKFVCLFVWEFSLIWRRQHDRWRAENVDLS